MISDDFGGALAVLVVTIFSVGVIWLCVRGPKIKRPPMLRRFWRRDRED